ncbi:MAG: acyl-CoA/acyl-ACP dehydrogenase [Phycisphaerae bacterium]|nr:acyl-CoA/acyl-ACP dehydrogenase [Phycisphaerae bacterium]
MTKDIIAFLKQHFSDIEKHTPYAKERLEAFLNLGPLHYFIPKSLGGRFQGALSYLNTIETTSYYSLPLGLTLGITGSLFLSPMSRHAAPELRDSVLKNFVDTPTLGGMMITEPAGGTDVFGLTTHYETNGDKLRLSGSKCWGGLTGLADHWLVGARAKRGDRLTKKLNLLYVPLCAPGVKVETYFDALGLQPIPYGRTQYDQVEIPETHILASEGMSGLRLLNDTLFRSRLGMPAIASGHCKRMADVASQRVNDRHVFGKALIEYDQVQYRIETLRGMAALNHALWQYTGKWMDDHADISSHYTLVNAAKLVCSETIQAASDSAVQLFASAAFKRNHIAGRAYVDSRPFPIFEGSNDVLDENLYDTVVSRHGQCNCVTVNQEFSQFGLSLPGRTPQSVLDLLDKRTVESQRDKVLQGRMLAWLFVGALHDQTAPHESEHFAQGQQLAIRRVAELAAQAPYLG